MASFALLAGMAQTHAEQVTLAAWDFANDVKYTASATDGQPVDLNNRRTTYKVDDDKLAAGETSPVTRQAVIS